MTKINGYNLADKISERPQSAFRCFCCYYYCGGDGRVEYNSTLMRIIEEINILKLDKEPVESHLSDMQRMGVENADIS